MMPEEKAAQERLRVELERWRAEKAEARGSGPREVRIDPRHLTVVAGDDIGLLLCAVGRLDYMEEKAEGIAGCRLCPEDRRFAARLILGWNPDADADEPY